MYSEVLKSNPNHDSRGRFARYPGQPSSASWESPNTKVKGKGLIPPGASLSDYAKKFDDPKATEHGILSKFGVDVMQEILSTSEKANSLAPSTALYSVNKDGTGGYTPERLRKHAEIIAHFLNPEVIARATPKEGTPPTLVLLGGRGGSGKSAFTHNEETGEAAKIKEFDSKKYLVLDSDAIKGMLKPPYAGWNAASVHEESDAIFTHIAETARRKGLNIVQDATMKSDKLQPTIDAYKEGGYRVEGHYMFVPRQEAARRAVGRFLGKGGKRGRLVPVRVVLSNTKNEANFDKLKPSFDKWSAYDNQGASPVLINRSE